MNTLIRSARLNARHVSLLAAAAGLLASVPALAQSATATGSFDKPLSGAAVAQPTTPRSTGDTTVVITSSENGKTYTVKMHNNEVSAEVDGKAVPADRLDRKGDVVIIKDKDGKAEKTFDVGVRSARSRWMTGAAAPTGGVWQSTPGVASGGGTTWTATAAEPPNPPPVMVGITMSNPDSSLAEHLGLNEDEVFVIDRVVDDLPAAKAGLEPLDVVTAIDGTKPASQDKFREVLRSKKAGDTLELTVVRKGAERKVKIELVAYDRAKLAPAGLGQLMVAPTADDPVGQRLELLRGLGGEGLNDSVRKHLEEALSSIQKTDKIKGDDARQQAEQALKQALESLSQSHARAAERYRAFADANGNHESIVLGDPSGQFFAMPGDRDMTKRLERLGDQLEKLNHRLEEIEKRLSEKK